MEIVDVFSHLADKFALLKGLNFLERVVLRPLLETDMQIIITTSR